jgi:hypothetical protein
VATSPASRVAAAVVLAAAVPVLSVGTAAPAHAAACPTGAGVTVVVDFNQLGGEVQEKCDGSGGGDSAASLFSSNGFPLTYAQRQPGFVCRVSGVPTSDPCVNTSPTNAYWVLYWSDGKSGTWSYSSLGAASLKVPNGGYVAFSWKQGSAAAPPSTSPTPHAPAPPTQPTQPTQSSQDSPSGGGNGSGGNRGDGNKGGNGEPGDDDGSQGGAAEAEPSGSTSPSASGPAAPSDTAKPSKPSKPSKQDARGEQEQGKKKRKESAEPSTSATSDPSVSPSDEVESDANPTASPPAPDDDGLPGWVAPGLIAVLFAAAGATVLVRRRGAAGQ